MRDDVSSPSTGELEPDFKAFFESAPHSYLVLDHDLTIVAVSDSYLEATMTQREVILGRHVFDVFPENPDEAVATGESNLRASFDRVLRDGRPDTMAVQKYDIRRPDSEGGGFEVRFWSPVNSPVFRADRTVGHIVHRVEDVTEFIKLKLLGAEQLLQTADLQVRTVQMETDIVQRSQELQEANRKMRLILDGTNDAFVSADADGRITGWNRKADSLFGMSSAEVVGRRLSVPLIPEQLDRALSGERVEDAELTVLAPDGAERSLIANSQSIVDDAGTRLGVVVTVRDFTERRKADAAILASQRQMAAAQQMAHVGSWEWDLPTNVFAFSEELCRVFGRDRAELSPTYESFLSCVHPDDRAAVERAVTQSMASGDPLGFDHRAVRPDGSVRDLRAHGEVVVGCDGTPVRITGTAQDITDAKRAAADLEASEARFRLLAAAAPVGVFQADAIGCYTYTNECWQELCGLQFDEAVGAGWVRAVHPEHREQALRGWRRATLDAESYADRLRVTTPSGIERWVDLRAVALRDPSGVITGFVGTATDVTSTVEAATALGAARDQAVEASRLKSQFLANMSHEIRTPMNGVLGMTSLLLATDLGDDQKFYAETVRGSAEVLLAILNDILDFSKIEAGKLDLEAIDFEVATVVEEVADLLSAQAHEKGVEMACSVPDDLALVVRGDPGRLRQILTNFAGNAVKFTGAGEVLIEMTLPDHDEGAVVVRFEVTDTGLGIAADHQSAIFDSFSQADASTTRDYGGTGLGLAICHQLVHLMGGELGVRSELGRGSTFWFTIPFERSKAAASAPAWRSLAGLRALVVDDNATNRAILSRFLTSWGMRAEVAAGAHEALAILAGAAASGDPFDAALVDLNMPGTDGLTFARLSAANPALSSVRLVMLTSSGLAGEGRQAREAGMAGYLTKPVRQAQLHDCLVKIMSGAPAGSALSPATEPAPPAPRRTRARGTILVAEDNTVNQQVAYRMLRALGFGVDVVEHGAAAIEAAIGGSYAAILMDCQMPGVDGYEATAQIRVAEGLAQHTPIIAVTASAMSSDKERCLAAGMDDYVSKPITMEALADIMNRWVADGEICESCRDPQATTGDPAFGPDVIDPLVVAALRQLGGAGEDPWGELSEAFLSAVPQTIDRIRLALAQDDSADVLRSVHSLRGASANIGATHLTRLCTALEDRSSTGMGAGGPQLLSAIEAELVRVSQAIRHSSVTT